LGHFGRGERGECIECIECIVYTTLYTKEENTTGICVWYAMNPTHPKHYALTAGQGVSRGEQKRECAKKVHSDGAEGTRVRRVLNVGKTRDGECKRRSLT